MAALRIFAATVFEEGITREWGPSFRNESADWMNQTIKLTRQWRYRVRIDDSARFGRVRGAALIPYIERAMEAQGDWDFTNPTSITRDYPVLIAPRSDAKVILQWLPLTRKGLLLTETAEPDIHFTVDGGYNVDVKVDSVTFG